MNYANHDAEQYLSFWKVISHIVGDANYSIYELARLVKPLYEKAKTQTEAERVAAVNDESSEAQAMVWQAVKNHQNLDGADDELNVEKCTGESEIQTCNSPEG